MLTRPAPYQASSTDRSQVALLFAMLGAMLGVLGLAGVLWLNSLYQRMQDQATALNELEKSAKQTAAIQRLALDTLLSKSSDGEVDRFTAQYDRASRERDEYYRQYNNQLTINNSIAARARELALENERLNKDVKAMETYEKDAKEVAKLRKIVDELEADSALHTKRLAEQEELLDTPEGKKALSALRKYDRTWYVAAAGWGVSLFLALGLVAALAYNQPATDPAPTPKPEPTEPPTHRIT